jgi:hypothetical protein
MSLTKRFLELTSSNNNLTIDEYIDQYHNNYYDEITLQQEYQEWLIKQEYEAFLDNECENYIELTNDEWLAFFALEYPE